MIDRDYYDNMFLQPPEPHEIPEHIFSDYVDDERNAEELSQVFWLEPKLSDELIHALVRAAYHRTDEAKTALLNMIEQFNSAIENRVEELVNEELQH